MKEGFSWVIIGSMLRRTNENFCMYKLEWASIEEKIYLICKVSHNRLKRLICSYLNSGFKHFLSNFISMWMKIIMYSKCLLKLIVFGMYNLIPSMHGCLLLSSKVIKICCTYTSSNYFEYGCSAIFYFLSSYFLAHNQIYMSWEDDMDICRR